MTSSSDARLDNLIDLITKITEATDKNSQDISVLISITRKNDNEIKAARQS